MSHSLTRIWIHSVWGIKNRFPFLSDTTRNEIIDHLKIKFDEFGCGVRIINGTEDHIYSLFLLNKNDSLKAIMKSIKGESSHWINETNFYKAKFSWQIGYGAFSVSESLVKKVERYIRNQKEHHKKTSFKEEWDLLIKKHNIIVSGNH
ncbi:MAG: transposase [Candidatus Cloacimonetes bacterium]|nr:transposase [Candidatus Cloacimonadota bacterium]